MARMARMLTYLARDILENDLQLQPSIENARRIGPFKDDGTPRPILAKFLYRPERFRVIQKKRDLRDSVRVSDDLIWGDRQLGKLRKDLGFIMACYTLTMHYIRLECLISIHFCIRRVSPILNIYIVL